MFIIIQNCNSLGLAFDENHNLLQIVFGVLHVTKTNPAKAFNEIKSSTTTVLKLVDEKQKDSHKSQEALQANILENTKTFYTENKRLTKNITAVVTLLLAAACGILFFFYKTITNKSMKYIKDRLQKQVDDRRKENKDKDAVTKVLKEEITKQREEIRKQKADILKHKVETDVQKRKYETLEVVINAIREENRGKDAAIAVLKAEEEKQKEENSKQKADILKQKAEIDEQKRKFETLQVSITEIRTEINRIRVPIIQHSPVYPPQGDMFTTNDYSSHN